MSNKGVLLIVSGLSGAGKGTIVKRLLEKYPDDYVLSISATTRNPRTGEEDGREYFFKTREDFENMISDGKLLEYASYVNNYYGTPKDWVVEQIGSEKNVILEIEIQGAFQVKKIMPDALMVFIVPPDMEELERRLRGRGTETEEQISERLATARVEEKFKDRYDYVINNVDVDESVKELNDYVINRKLLQLQAEVD